MGRYCLRLARILLWMVGGTVQFFALLFAKNLRKLSHMVADRTFFGSGAYPY
jgi:hypothetical protein